MFDNGSTNTPINEQIRVERMSKQFPNSITNTIEHQTNVMLTRMYTTKWRQCALKLKTVKWGTFH